VDPKVYSGPFRLLPLIDQIVLTAEVEAQDKEQTLDIKVDPELIVVADQQLLHSALSNLIQNALKYTRRGGKIQVRGKIVGEEVVIEVEDECGGLPANAGDLFKPFEQRHENRKGLGLGLTIAQRAVRLNRGEIEVRNLPAKGCVFTITVPQKAENPPLSEPAA
jgi:signal transduction histidine kinase